MAADSGARRTRAGERTCRLDLLKRETTPDTDEFAQPLVNYVPFAVAWAKLEQIEGGEVVSGSQPHSLATLLVKIPWRPDLDSTMRLRFRDRVFEIVDVLDPDEKRMEFHLSCREIK